KFYHKALKNIECLKVLDMALKQIRRTKNIREESLFHVNIAGILQEMGDSISSLEELQIAYNLAQQIDDKNLNNWIKLSFGGYFHSVEEPDLALDKYMDVFTYFQQQGDQVAIAGVCLNIAIAYEMKGDAENSEKYHRRTLSLLKELNQDIIELKVLEIKSKFCLGAMLTGLHVNIEEGVYFLKQSLDDSIRLSLTNEEFVARLQLAETYEYSGDDQRALEELLIAKGLETDGVSLHNIRETLWQLARIEERRGNVIQGFHYLKEYADVVIKSEKEIQERRSVELEVQLYRMEEKRKNELLEKELQAKQRINEAVSFHAREREKFLTKLQKRLMEIESTVSKKSKKQIIALEKEIKDIMTSKKEWSDFEQGFIEAHSELEQKLTAQFPSLTTAERKVCILLRAGRSTKEIAQLLHISSDTADTHRTRIRKKLRLEHGKSIQSILSTL
ncbi:MAG: hypothetical protein HYZ54_01935, partial [Ignavibacteriae bacterium]|nr:hypothetical protein [Ignavibacteriota bacterium]